MKKIAVLALALVIIFALAGCEMTTRGYRRGTAGRTIYNDTPIRAAEETPARVRTRTRTYNAGDPAIIERDMNTGTNRTTVPGISPYDTYARANRGTSPATRFGINTPAAPVNPITTGTGTDQALPRGNTANKNAADNTTKTQDGLRLNKAR